MPIPYLDNITRCETIINYTFHDKRLCCEALKMTGNDINWPNRNAISTTNGKLAVLGDIRVAAELCRRWCTNTSLPRGESEPVHELLDVHTFLGIWEGSICQSVVTNETYNQIGRQYHLDECVIPNPGTTTVLAKSMATTVEAIMGAVFFRTGASLPCKLSWRGWASCGKI